MKTLNDFMDFSSVECKFRGSYVQNIFDHIQTHALYGIPKEDVSRAKEELGNIGAKRFRMVKNSYGFYIICFKISPKKDKKD